MKKLCLLVVILFGTGACSSTVAVVDVAATTAIYTAKTAVNVVDAITPDIIN
tara:strand:+ start:2428 stop:2583 length:156 start_codon:yes stop_codon:yes gene_type:complete